MEKDAKNAKKPIAPAGLFVLILGIIIIAFCAMQSILYFSIYFSDAPLGNRVSVQEGTFLGAWIKWNNSADAQRENALVSAIFMLVFAMVGVLLVVLGKKNLHPPEKVEEERSSRDMWEYKTEPRKRRNRQNRINF